MVDDLVFCYIKFANLILFVYVTMVISYICLYIIILLISIIIILL